MMLIPALYTKTLVYNVGTSSTFYVHFNPKHPLYSGHFPEMPVTPGICLIQAASEALQEAVGSSLRLAEARQIKFLQMHSPENHLRFELSWGDVFKRLRGRISIFQDNKCIAKIDALFERT